MLIGLNLLYLIPGKVGGTETYARELIFHLSKTHQLVLFCGRETAPTFTQSKNIQVITLPINSNNRLARILAEQILLPIYSLRYKLDVLFSLGYSAPFLHPCPSVVTIHDLNWHYHPEDFSPLNRFAWEWLTRLSARFSDHVITDSQYSRESLIQVLGLRKEKVTAILHATPTVLPTSKQTSQLPYIFTVLADYPHKNLASLLAAFARISSKRADLDLVICGLGNQPSSSKRIKYLGYVTRVKLAELYAEAEVFVFPSAYEGFGYPVLEAMSYGTPVVSSRATSLAEVVGDGGILVDPYDVGSYVKAITKLLGSKKERSNWIKRGRQRASELKWEDTAKATLDVLKKVNAL